jgi:hypothetical protein
MPPITTEITTYSVGVISPGDPNDLAATIWLFDANHSLIAFLRFYHAGSVMVPNQFRHDLNAAEVSYPFDTFPSVVDLLRNETPVYFTWFDYSPTNRFGAIETSREPIGEQEGM